ncbi:MAG: ABC transporter permease [Oligoflexia bacterium]|nr:ABC transporter permease [Oligoflexia bacterium]
MRTVLSRTLTTVLLLATIFVASRAMVRALPGDPLETLVAESGTTIPIEELRRELSLDRPFLPALAEDVRRFSQGDFGTSLFSKKPVAPLLARSFNKTLQLALFALVLATLLAVPLGLLAAATPGGKADRACSWYGGLSAALPMPWLGPLLLVAFAVWLPIFPAGGHIALPALALAITVSGLWARLIRERVRETLQRGAAPGARARGVPEWRVLVKYGLAPASGSLLAYFGTQVGGMLAGAFIVESVFDWDGLGSLLIDAVLRRDYPVIEAGTFLTAACSLIGTQLGDWLQFRFDPRLQTQETHATLS